MLHLKRLSIWLELEEIKCHVGRRASLPVRFWTSGVLVIESKENNPGWSRREPSTFDFWPSRVWPRMKSCKCNALNYSALRQLIAGTIRSPSVTRIHSSLISVCTEHKPKTQKCFFCSGVKKWNNFIESEQIYYFDFTFTQTSNFYVESAESRKTFFITCNKI